MTKPTKKQRRADWRHFAAYLRTKPGVWHDVPDAMPMLNPTVVRDGGYPSAFWPPLAFEARGAKGRQSARYVGDPRDMHRELYELGRDPRDVTRRVSLGAEGLEAGVERAGFTTLPLDAREAAPPEPPVESATDERPVIREAGRSHWPAVATTLREHPGSWFRVLGRFGSLAPKIKTGGLVAFRPAGDFEARVRDYELEVRFVGSTIDRPEVNR